MMKMRLQKTIILLLILFGCNVIGAANKSSADGSSVLYDMNTIKDSLKIENPTKYMVKTKQKIYYLDKEQVLEAVISEMEESGRLVKGKECLDSRTAIRLYGEKARFGIAFFNSKQ
ncbi:MAG: hypothetical protein QM654_06925 [Dysgonamonadaceae bacterium]